MTEIVQAELVEEGTAVAPRMDVQALMSQAIASGDGEASVALMERLMDLRDREVRHNAEQALNQALAEFARRCPPIPRSKKGKRFKDGTQLFYADLEKDADPIVLPLMAELGLTRRWTHEVENRTMVTRCIITHELGASTTSSIGSGLITIPEANAAQIAAGTRTTLKRLTLFDALGLATQEELPGEAALTEEEIDEIRSLYMRKNVSAKRAGSLWRTLDIEPEAFHTLTREGYGTASRLLEMMPDKEDA